MFLLACIFQFLSDILLFETTECVIMSFLIPNLIQKEVQSAGFILHQAFQQIISSSLSSEPVEPMLDAPSYLFVST
jgi:hypothetical protein